MVAGMMKLPESSPAIVALVRLLGHSSVAVRQRAPDDLECHPGSRPPADSSVGTIFAGWPWFGPCIRDACATAFRRRRPAGKLDGEAGDLVVAVKDRSQGSCLNPAIPFLFASADDSVHGLRSYLVQIARHLRAEGQLDTERDRSQRFHDDKRRGRAPQRLQRTRADLPLPLSQQRLGRLTGESGPRDRLSTMDQASLGLGVPRRIVAAVVDQTLTSPTPSRAPTDAALLEAPRDRCYVAFAGLALAPPDPAMFEEGPELLNW